MSLRTPICELLGIEYPIVLAGMGEASTPALAAAVSNAGGLGVIGAAATGPTRLAELIEETQRLTDRPFGVDTLLPASVTRGEKSAASSEPPDLAEYSRFAQEFMQREDGLWGVYRFKRGFGGWLTRTVRAWDRVYSPLRYRLYCQALRWRRVTA